MSSPRRVFAAIMLGQILLFGFLFHRGASPDYLRSSRPGPLEDRSVSRAIHSELRTLDVVMAKHAALQDKLRSGSEPLHALVYTCRRNMFCGGWADRLEGIIVTYFLAVLAGRAFFIDYDKPQHLDRYFTPAQIDWRLANLASDDMETLNSVSTHSVKRRRDTRNCSRLVDYVLHLNTNKKAIRINTNQGKGCVRRLIDDLKLGRVHRDAMARAYAWLFKESPYIRDVIHQWELKWTPSSSICVHIRKGGRLGFNQNTLSSGSKMVDITERIRHRNLTLFWTCGQMVFNTSVKPTLSKKAFSWLVVSDNAAALDMARRELPRCSAYAGRKASVIDTTSLGPVVHIDKLGKYRGVSAGLIENGTLRVFVDHLLLARCKYLVASHSSFSLSAAAIARKHKMTVFLVDWQRTTNEGGPACTEVDPVHEL